MKEGKKVNKGIPIHPKHGLNPTIPVCFYCGKEKNEIALLGAHYRDEAPKNMVTSLEPCDECKEKYSEEYTLLVETAWDIKTKSRHTPTGRWVAIRKSCLNVENPGPIAFVESETMNHLISQAQMAGAV